ncbi:MAG: Asp-tRNA(Asn)/Glu-tRNA(Gln) amidotransferase subunit GatC [Caedimonadaceae bacterium]|nr:MAG: Asp-tRNA(Asn)/Glu-tRNA(Gln) amidotransferase subunit GatC [Caedimonadaceae bacterium]
MVIDSTVIRKVARLARIRVSPEQEQHFSDEISKMLQWMEMLNEVDTNHVSPMFSVNQDNMARRDDVVTDGNYVDDILANAPNAAYGMFIVPKVIE